MHIQDAGGPAGGKVRTEDGEEAGQNNEVDLMRRQQVGQGGLKGRLTAAALGGDRLGRNAGVGRPGQGVGSFIGGPWGSSPAACASSSACKFVPPPETSTAIFAFLIVMISPLTPMHRFLSAHRSSIRQDTAEKRDSAYRERFHSAQNNFFFAGNDLAADIGVDPL